MHSDKIRTSAPQHFSAPAVALISVGDNQDRGNFPSTPPSVKPNKM